MSAPLPAPLPPPAMAPPAAPTAAPPSAPMPASLPTSRALSEPSRGALPAWAAAWWLHEFTASCEGTPERRGAGVVAGGVTGGAVGACATDEGDAEGEVGACATALGSEPVRLATTSPVMMAVATTTRMPMAVNFQNCTRSRSSMRTLPALYRAHGVPSTPRRRVPAGRELTERAVKPGHDFGAGL